MYFDPLSTWLVALILDGIIIADEKTQAKSITEYEQERIRQENKKLNNEIRRVKNDYGLVLPDMAYEKIQRSVEITIKSLPTYNRSKIVIYLDNQEYIIELLDACAKRYDEYSYDEAQNKAEWYRNAAIEAKRKKEQYTLQLEETRIKRKKEREEAKTWENIMVVVGLVLIVFGILYLFS